VNQPSDTLLVVDDNEMNRDMLSRRLRRLGYTVAVAVDGAEALACLGAREHALVLLDIEMPGVSGIEVLKAARERHSPAALPIIMVSSRQESQSAVEALNLGANDYVTKPIDFAVVVARIEAQLARRRAEAALRESEERYALAVRGANDGLWDWNLLTGELHVSPRWKLMLGLEDVELAGDPEEWFGRVHPDDAARFKEALSAHIKGQSPHFEAEHRILHKSGAYMWARSRGLAVRDENGQAYRMAGSQTDITAGKVADPLTGLPNRILFMDRLAHAIERSRRYPDYLCAVLFLDLDRFKLVNDSLGHAAGDQLLVAIARRLESCLRCNDTIARIATEHTLARLGGDEFTVLLDDIGRVSDALRVAVRIQEHLAQSIEIDGHEVFTTASIGIATTATAYDSPQAVVRDADTAMYRAKALGGARSELFDSEMRERAVARLRIETDMRRAIDRDEFVVHYQPIVALDTGRIAGFEALVRWQHPERGLVLPAEFIPIAEETGAILPIGSRVLREACRQTALWLGDPQIGHPLTISVNLSVKQFLQPDLLDEITSVLRDTGVPAYVLTLEITESTLLEGTDAVVAKLHDLKALGVRLSIDDFGTGYSSLSAVHRFPLDAMKIDRSFVSSMAENSEIIRVIVALARSRRLKVVAEGVETLEQLAELKAARCDFAQGRLFSMPLGVEAVRELLESAGETGILGPAHFPPAA
jgi:diguanylate cyclase (GGDEF)-like protein/PAS domain S-box-containing protein